MSLDDHCLDQLFQPSDGKTPQEVSLGGVPVPMKLRYSKECKNLLVSFHGAVDRNTRTPPVFSPLLPGLGDSVAQLSVSDPSMMREGAFSMAWYSGHEGFRAQDILADFFRAIARSGRFERVVFFGSSGGGFASLYFSSLLPESIAVVGVPQTNMRRYYSVHIKKYREGCWPSLASDDALAREICTDLCKWYSAPRPNTVIYLQSAGDHFHTQTQFIPFMTAISEVKDSRFIAYSGFWGKLGHSGAITSECYLPWIRAAFLSPSIEVDDLLVTHRNLTEPPSQPLEPKPDSGGRQNAPDASDIRLAALLRDYHLRQPTEG